MNEVRGAAAPVSVLLVDDQPLQRMGMQMFLAGQDDLDVVGEAVDGDDAIRQAERLRPDLVIMDVRMPGTDGIDATRQIIAGLRGTRVLLLTTFDVDEYVIAGLEAGASGFLTKDAEPTEILSAIRAIAAGDAVIAPSATRRLLDRLAATPLSWRDNEDRSLALAAVTALTDREREILVAIGEGATNAEIAKRLHLAESTVKNYVGRVFAKIGARDRVHAVIIAFRAGAVPYR
ncbi:response regulator transcription factor [Streptosporangium sp. NPDC006013]|uniref:response regulator transcription factor n=1 Tax=Streptosporangium sp. NPDC006013 TaxID=3155596 RepID=UPI0033B031D4